MHRIKYSCTKFRLIDYIPEKIYTLHNYWSINNSTSVSQHKMHSRTKITPIEYLHLRATTVSHKIVNLQFYTYYHKKSITFESILYTPRNQKS